ncbi:MAG: hypothetical protein N2327_02540 [Caldimicrobium sp.]|nr:hypothetical protein [Caldimicrobium sp.]MCX7873299.1 hypothetical protein [Caldimicrobium sp.]MDW8093463.1 hypothetical protein [Caldimicrobium sp.]
MSLTSPPKAEKLLPLVRTYLSINFNLLFPEDLKPFSENTLEILSKKNSQREALLLLERFIIENYTNGFYKKELLESLLSLGEPIGGYLFTFEGEPPKDFCFFNIDEGLYFYPLHFGEITALYITLWKRGLRFNSCYKPLSFPLDVETLKKDIKQTKALGFSRLTPRALGELKDIWELMSSSEIHTWMETLKNQGVFLLVGSEPLNKPPSLKDRVKIYKQKGSYYLVEAKNEKILQRYLERTSQTWGVLNSAKLQEELYGEIHPFVLAYASLSHAQRANKKIHFLDPFTLHVLADLYYEWEDLGKALELYKKAKPYTLQSLELTLSEASIYYALGELKEAERSLKSKLCGCLEEDPRIHYNLGIIYLDLGDKERGEFHLYKAYLLNKEEPLFRRKLMDFLWEENRIQEIEAILQEVSLPTREDKIYLGKCAFLKGDYVKAMELLKEILTLQERDGYSLFFLAWLYLYFGKEREACSVLLKEAEKNLSPEAFNKLKEEFGLPS